MPAQPLFTRNMKHDLLCRLDTLKGEKSNNSSLRPGLIMGYLIIPLRSCSFFAESGQWTQQMQVRWWCIAGECRPCDGCDAKCSWPDGAWKYWNYHDKRSKRKPPDRQSVFHLTEMVNLAKFRELECKYPHVLLIPYRFRKPHINNIFMS